MFGNVHQHEMKNFRATYRIAPLEQCLKLGIGTCIEQVYLMHTIFCKIDIQNKMYCCRIYEPDNYGNLEEEEHMHCFLLYYHQGKVYHIEHPNVHRMGIFEYDSETAAINFIEQYYIELRGGKQSPTTEFYSVESGFSFQQFNNYINFLDRQ